MSQFTHGVCRDCDHGDYTHASDCRYAVSVSVEGQDERINDLQQWQKAAIPLLKWAATTQDVAFGFPEQRRQIRKLLADAGYSDYPQP